MNLSLCPDSSPSFLNFFDLSIAPPLLFYVYIPILLISLFFGSYVWSKSKEDPSTKYLAFITLSFGGWILLILFQWVAAYLEVVHLAWQLLVIPEILIYIFAVCFCYTYLYKKDINYPIRYGFSLIYVVAVTLIPTSLNITSFDLINCEGVIGVLWYAIYIFELICLVLIFVIAFESYYRSSNSYNRKRTILLPLGLIFFIGIFWISNYFGELTKTYEINLIGPIGMILFLMILSYMIISLNTFNIKIIGTQAIVIGVWFLVFALLFIQRIEFIRLLTVATLIMLFVIGYFLIKSVKREIEAKERIEKLAGELQTANEGQANLIHIINHQIKGYLAKARNIFSELLSEPSYGPVSDTTKPMLEEGFNSLTEGVNFVTDFLTASNIEKGTFVYDMQSIDFKKIVTEVSEKQKEMAKEKNLSLELAVADGDYGMKGDANQLGQAVRNLIDNSIKYTPKGEVKIQMSKVKDKILLKIEDTGVGISSELKPRLFTKGGKGKDSIKLNVNSTGFGLSFVKDVVEAHKGRVWAESLGVNKGSTFYLELPVAAQVSSTNSTAVK
ncbi:MAG: ATP-binding protein [bacterium]|nr:ATP-binding protein [bacterium]